MIDVVDAGKTAGIIRDLAVVDLSRIAWGLSVRKASM